jgi:protein SCO1/2
MTQTRIALLLLLCLSAALFVSCNNKPASNASQTPAKRYQLKGKVVSVDQKNKTVDIDSAAIPGFMDAMTMPYSVKPESELEQLHPGDSIAADLVVTGDGGWLENIVITGHAAATAGQKK